MESAFMFFTSLHPKNPPSNYILPDKSTNYLFIGGYPWNGQSFSAAVPIFTPQEAYAIDAKIDDGLPMSGMVMASYINGGSHCYGSGGTGISIQGPCFNSPSIWNGSSYFPARGGCVNTTTTPYSYNTAFGTPTSKSLAAGNGVPYFGYCNIHEPVN